MPLLSPWAERIGRLLAPGMKSQKAAALEVLEQTCSRRLPLFGAERGEAIARQGAWLARIQLLLEWGRPMEALAWICLEGELGERAGEVPSAARAARDWLLATLAGDAPAAQTAAVAKAVQWPGIAGRYEVKARLERDVVGPHRYPELARRHGLTPPTAVCLWGPAGYGKRFFAAKIEEKLGPGVLAVTTSEQPPEGSLAIFIGLPDYAERLAMYREYLKPRFHERMEWDELATDTERYSAAEVLASCEQAARYAEWESSKVKRPVAISANTFRGVIPKLRPAAGFAPGSRYGAR